MTTTWNMLVDWTLKLVGFLMVVCVLAFAKAFYSGEWVLAGQLFAAVAVLFVFAGAICPSLSARERYRLAEALRKEDEARFNDDDSSGGTPLFSEEAEYEAEGRRLRRSQERMNLDDAGLLRPLPFKGRDH